MLKVDAMAKGEMTALLLRSSFGHLGCSRDGHTYVVPMNYAFDGEHLYFLTTEGTKTQFITANREICFQVEEITDSTHWRSVMLIGDAEHVTKPEETERIMRLILERNPTLTPALSKTDIGAWHRQNRIAIYCVRPSAIYGRKTV